MSFPSLRSAVLALLLLCGGLLAGTAQAGVVGIGAGDFQRKLGRDLEVFIDKTGTLGLDDIRRLPDSAFTPVQQDTPNFSFSPHRFWLRLRLHWQAPDRDGYALWQQYPLTDHFTLYRPDGQGGYVASHAGDQHPFASRELPTRAFGFPLTPRPGQTETYYVELHGAGTIYIDLELASTAAALAATENRHLLLGLYYGGLIALLLYNLVLFFTLRERVYLYYSLYVASLGLTFFDLNGLAFRYLWPDTVWMNTGFLVFTFASFFAQLQFTRHFLQLKTQWPRLDRLLVAALFICGAALAAVFVLPEHYLFSGSQRVTAVVALLCLVAGIRLWQRGYKPARYFTLASGFYIVGMLIYVMQNFGWLPTSAFTNHSVQIGSSLELVLFSFALADRINHMKDEKAALEADAHLQLLRHNQTLEQRVEARTQELVDSLHTVNEKHAALVAMQQQLVQSEKMSSLGALVAGVAHEINNPANFTRLAAENVERDIRGLQEFLGTLADEHSDPALLAELTTRFGRIREQLTLVHDGARRLALIVQDLRSFSRLDEAEAQLAAPDAGLDATLNLVRAQYGDRIGIHLTRAHPDAAGFCNPAALNQVFMNLAVNACQAILEKHRGATAPATPLGRLDVATRLDADGRWHAEFRDDGIGMDAATQARIFEPFFTTKDVGAGTGLGLSVSYGIVRKHGGDIRVSATPGQGSCFHVQLPLTAGVPGHAALKPDNEGVADGTV
jgi:signal transduction histidine kinase